MNAADDHTADDHTSGEGRPRLGGRRRTVARLAAVQALYQLELNPELDAQAVVREFARYRFDQEIDGDQLAEADAAFFSDIVRGVTADQERLDLDISTALVEDWPLNRLDAVLRAILRAGVWELVHRADVPARVSISEYIAIAHAFFTGKEPGLANGVLNRLGRGLRAADM
ncbi:MAG TPA: transcription antitermination factor NusB [Stellaceae bacterium]|jgi:N utilization substance protein B|nr:transcription antitermination factor NusB [Stellaceae bacterium]